MSARPKTRWRTHVKSALASTISRTHELGLAETGADDHARGRGIGRRIESRLPERFDRGVGGPCGDRLAAALARRAGNLARKRRAVVAGVEPRDRTQHRAPVDTGAPERLRTEAGSRHGSETGDDDSPRIRHVDCLPDRGRLVQ